MRELKYDLPEVNEEPIAVRIGAETFMAVPFVPGTVILDFSASLLSEYAAISAAGVLRFLRRCFTAPCERCDESGEDPTQDGAALERGVPPTPCADCNGAGGDVTEWRRFLAFCDHRNNHVPTKLLAQISQDLQQKYGEGAGNRPTGGPSASPAGGSRTQEPSTPARDSQE